MEDVEQVASFLVACAEGDQAPASQVRRLACLRSFYRYALSEGWVSANVAQDLEGPKLWNRLPMVLSVKEVERLLLISEQAPWPKRNKALLELLYGCGLRVSELCSLGLADVSFEEAWVQVQGKGNKERRVPLGDPAQRALENYVETERPQLVSKRGETKPLWLGERGGALSRKSVHALVQQWGRDGGLEKPVHPHLFRHSYATHLLENGADLRVIQELLGHADISTTQRYTQVDASRLKREFLNRHPRS